MGEVTQEGTRERRKGNLGQDLRIPRDMQRMGQEKERERGGLHGGLVADSTLPMQGAQV